MIGHITNHELSKNQRIWNQSLWFSLISLILIITIITIHYSFYTSAESLQRESQEKLNLKIGKTTIITELSNIQSDVNFLARQAELHRYFDEINTQTLAIMAKDFQLFSDKKHIYDQIRLLDINGQEVIRINNQNGKSSIVEAADLQNKQNRYYFKESLLLDINNIYISPFDLNVEHGQIQKPLKPVIRFGTPVFNSSGKKVGVLILNYQGNKLLSNFRNSTKNIEQHIMLLNSDGYWLSHYNHDMEWGFMLDHKHTFATDYQPAWEKISKLGNGQFLTEKGLFTFSTIYPRLELTQASNNSNQSISPASHYTHSWIIVSYISSSELTQIKYDFFRDNSFFYLMIFLIFLGGSFIIALLNTKHQLVQIEIEFESHFRKVLESIQLNVLAVDTDGSITFCNDALLNLIGWNRNELIGKQWIDTLVVNKYKKTCTDLFFNTAIEHTQPTTHESWFQDLQGNEYLIRWHDTIMRDADNKPIGFIFMGEDITQYRKNEIRIRHLSEAVEQSPASVILTNQKGMIEYVNPKFEQLTGYTLEEIKGLNPRILKSGETNIDDYDDLWEKIKKGKTWKGIFHNRKKNNELYWESASISGIKNPEGEITHFLAVKEDITEQKMLEERFKHCFNAAPVSMIMSDQTGKIILANDELLKLYGYQEKQLLGKHIEILIPNEAYNHTLIAPIEKSSLRVAGKSTDYLAYKNTGEAFPIELGISSTPTFEGVMQIYAIIDLTSRQKLETELLHRNEEISRNQAINTVGKMANMIAHDLRNPLSSIKMGLQIVQKQSNNISHDDVNELNQIALEQVHYMEEILADLMSYSRPDALNLEWVDIRKIIGHSISLIQKEIDSKKAKINTKFDEGLPIISADSRKLRQVLSNLLTNAIQSVESLEGVIPDISVTTELDLGSEKSYIKICITDNGCGINEEIIDQLFEPFHTTRSKGTGLGLSIAKRFIELQHGELRLNSNKEGGCTATVKLNIDPAQ
ncbi:MAG: PAS domain S-box protein [Bacteroidetes bacterium]|nr:PAS domain S-box protein [Bacteroidota bacterium]